MGCGDGGGFNGINISVGDKSFMISQDSLSFIIHLGEKYPEQAAQLFGRLNEQLSIFFEYMTKKEGDARIQKKMLNHLGKQTKHETDRQLQRIDYEIDRQKKKR
jgi:hypothetical protein